MFRYSVREIFSFYWLYALETQNRRMQFLPSIVFERCFSQLLHENFPLGLPEVQCLMLFLIVHAAVNQWINRQLLETPEIRLGAHETHKGFIKIVAERFSIPKAGIIAGNNDRWVQCEQSGRGMISHILHEAKNLIRDGTNLHCNPSLLHHVP